MINSRTPQKTDLGWVIEIPPEMAQAMGVAEGSLVVLYPKEGGSKQRFCRRPPRS